MATAVAMLCVLREDLLLELYGVARDHFEQLDDNEAFYRRTYFWRNSFRTLEEIKKVLQRLNAQGEFQDALAREPAAVRTAFETLNRELNEASRDFLKDLRNAIGGHLNENTVQQALDTMDPEREGYLVVGERLGRTHYRFAAEIIWSIVLQDVPEKEHGEKAEELLRRTARLSQAVSAIDDAVGIYVEKRRPHRR